MRQSTLGELVQSIRAGDRIHSNQYRELTGANYEVSSSDEHMHACVTYFNLLNGHMQLLENVITVYLIN
jgi:hypothetical protein